MEYAFILNWWLWGKVEMLYSKSSGPFGKEKRKKRFA